MCQVKKSVFQIFRMAALRFISFLCMAGSALAVCTNPKVKSRHFQKETLPFLSGHCLILHPLRFSGVVLRTVISWELTFFIQVLAAIPFIAEFKLACDGGEVRGFKLQMEDKQGMQL